jgi:protein-L-isoaspartate(D-aspartate) O-methyltransferase
MSSDNRPPRFPLRLDRVKAQGGVTSRELLRPQRLLHEAVADARRKVAPSGLGLDSAGVRVRMVERLRAEGLRNEAVIAAMSRVPRHEFVDSALAAQAYEDTALPIGHQQTISAPSTVSVMAELLMGGENARSRGQLGRVLEIGTGCGYQAAVLACLATQVLSIERIKPLHDQARERLARLVPNRVRLVYGDGRLGHAPNAPYDSIIAAASGEALPQAWLDQLAVGGRLVAPVASPQGDGQVLVVVDRHATGYERSLHEAVMFVPLRSGLD